MFTVTFLIIGERSQPEFHSISKQGRGVANHGENPGDSFQANVHLGRLL
jgi:hypothetical protein